MDEMRCLGLSSRQGPPPHLFSVALAAAVLKEPWQSNDSWTAAHDLSLLFVLLLLQSNPPPQVAVKNNIDVFYFSCQYPISMLFVEDGKMGECWTSVSPSLPPSLPLPSQVL